MSSIADSITNLIKSITELPSTIINGIKDIFIPDIDVIKIQFNDTVDRIKRSFNLNLNSMEDLSEGLTEKPVTDIRGDYKIYGISQTFNLKFLDASFIQQGVDYFRPLMRGFLVLMLLLYNYKQLLLFIGQDPAISHNAEKNYERWEAKQNK